MTHQLLLLLLLPIAAAELCAVLDKTNAQVERTATGAGLHRLLATTMWVSSSSELSHCTVALQEDLPSGAYMDPDQLRRLQGEWGSLPPIVVAPVDVEAGEWESRPTPVMYYPPMHPQQSAPNTADSSWLVNFTVPIHVRYHRARSSVKHGTEAQVHVAHPTVLLLCPHWPPSCRPHTVPLPCNPGDPQQRVLTDNDPPHEHHGVLPDDGQQHTVLPDDGQQQRMFPDGAPPSAGGEEDFPKLRRGHGLQRESRHSTERFGSLPTCYWLPLHSFSTTEGVTMSVPVGNTDQLEVVLVVTTTLTMAATLLLLTPLLRQYREQTTRGVKQD